MVRTYIRVMPLWFGPILFVVTILAMEGVAYVAHRWIMHGGGWFLHASHHRRNDGWWEANDWYFVIFAAPSIALLVGGTYFSWGAAAVWIGAGIAGYGAIYLGFHDVIVHKRFKTRYLPKSNYMKHIIQAHRLHHAVETKHGTVSFGFLWAPKPEALKAELKRRGNAGVRAASTPGSSGAASTALGD